MILPPYCGVLLKSKVHDSQMAHRQHLLITLILFSIFISLSDIQAFEKPLQHFQYIHQPCSHSSKVSLPIKIIFQRNHPRIKPLCISDIEKIYYYTLVTAMFRTALEEYCINYIIPLGALLTLKCLMRLAKDLSKENLFY